MKAVPDKKTSARTGAAPARPTAPAQAQDRPTVEGSGSPATAAGPETAPPAGLAPQQLRLLQARAGNAAVARLVAQRQTAAPPSTAAPAPASTEAPAPPVKPPPSASPAFQGLKSEVRAKKTASSRHAPAAAESKAAQDAAVAPPDDKQAQGKAAQAEKMNAAKPGVFDKAGFIAAVNQAIAAQAPKNLAEAADYSGSGKAEAVKGQVSGQVGQGKAASAKEIATATEAAPDLSKAKDKPVTPLTPDAPPPVPGTPDPAGAVPARQPDAVTDFSGGPRQIDQQMADAEVTEDQLARSNEPQFTDALTTKKEGEQHSAAAPGQARGAEAKQLAAAKQGAAAAGARAMTGLAAARTTTGKQVDGGKGATKSADERKRAEVTARLQKVFDATKSDVEKTLSGLDKLVDEKFTAGEKAARDAFTADHKRRMDAYKDKRYSGFTGKLRWVKDKFAGMPEEANQLFQESRKLYVARMQQVISSIADVIGTELGRAKDRVAKGRAELKAEVDRLPADLRKFGQDAAKDFTEKFDGLEADVNAKSDQLVQDLAQKYTQALNAVDDEIKKLQEENKGLIAKARDAVVGVIQTIIELKNMLLGVLAKAATAVMQIIKDPIGFLRNLVTAVSAGLRQFIGNIAEHLKKGLVSWLLGAAAGAGLALPAKFDLKGIIQLVSGLLGLTWSNIRARITRKGVPDQAVSAAEQSVPVAQALQREGPAGAVEHIKESVGDLKSTILQKLTAYLIPTVIVAGISWVVSLLTPASAFVRAVKGIIDIVTFVVTQGGQIVQFVNSILDAIVAIANGGGGGVPALVEGALVASIPVLIGFLASLLGIGNLAGKIRQVFTAVARPVNKAIDKIVDFIAKAAKKLWGKFRKNKKEKPADKQEKETGKTQEINFAKPLSMHRTPHTLYVKTVGGRVQIGMASAKIEKLQSLLAQAMRSVPDGPDKPAIMQQFQGIAARLNELDKESVYAKERKATEDALKRQVNDIAELLEYIGREFGYPSLKSLGHASAWVVDGELKNEYRGKQFRESVYGGWQSTTLAWRESHRARMKREKTDIRWNTHPLKSVPETYVCPSYGGRPPHIADPRENKGLLSLDHKSPSVSVHWMTKGRDTTHPVRNSFYNDTSNLEPMCKSCNSSKGGDEITDYTVTSRFRGNGE
ncbi:hypothetical protein ACFCYX_16105 [Streptomyces populi]|uniref:phage tail protein n=1 Tax=Streptomyces populi TaxID=2058924 RepID=UPI0035D832EB